MFTIALIGADGAGKTSVGRRVVESFPLPIKYLYMGINLECSRFVLPTTRLVLEWKRATRRRPVMTGPPDPTRVRVAPKGWPRRALASVKSQLRIANLVAEEWFRQIVAWFHRSRGYIVLCDRHFYLDYGAYDLGNRRGKPGGSLAARLHLLMLSRLYPRPDLVIYLDAPAEVLFDRKREGTIELLEHRRREYLGLRDRLPHFEVIDCTQPQDDVARDVCRRILSFHAERQSRRSSCR